MTCQIEIEKAEWEKFRTPNIFNQNRHMVGPVTFVSLNDVNQNPLFLRFHDGFRFNLPKPERSSMIAVLVMHYPMFI
jgi:hypothetical protein